MVNVRSVSSVLTRVRLELTSRAYTAINVNSCLQALTKDISTPADIAPSALETIIFYCFMGYISALTYYLLLPSLYCVAYLPAIMCTANVTSSIKPEAHNLSQRR